MLGWMLLNPPQHPGQLTAGLRLSPMTDEQPGFSQPRQPTLVQAWMSAVERGAEGRRPKEAERP